MYIKKVESDDSKVVVTYDFKNKERKTTAYRKLKDGTPNPAIPYLKEGTTIEPRVAKVGNYWNIVGIKSGPGASGKSYNTYNKGGGKTDEDYAIMCLSYAKDLCVASKVETPAITNTADIFFAWYLKKKAEIKNGGQK